MESKAAVMRPRDDASSRRMLACRGRTDRLSPRSVVQSYHILLFAKPQYLTSNIVPSLSSSIFIVYFKRPSSKALTSTSTSLAFIAPCVVVVPSSTSISNKRLDVRRGRRSRIKVGEKLFFYDNQERPRHLNGDACVDVDVISMTTLRLVTPQDGKKYALASQKRSSVADYLRGSKYLP